MKKIELQAVSHESGFGTEQHSHSSHSQRTCQLQHALAGIKPFTVDLHHDEVFGCNGDFVFGCST